MTGENSHSDGLCPQEICRRHFLKMAAAGLLAGCNPTQQRIATTISVPTAAPTSTPTATPIPTDTPEPTLTLAAAPTTATRPTRKPVTHYVAYCGHNCTRCPSYSSKCDGCLVKGGGQLQPYPTTCGIRACAIERDVVNCAHCEEYACARLERHFARSLMSKAALDEVRQSLE